MQPDAGRGPLAGLWVGKANARGPAPAWPTPHGAELGLKSSYLATPHPTRSWAFSLKALASVSSPQTESTTAPGWLVPQLLPKPSRTRGQVRGHGGGRDEPPRLAQAPPGQPLQLRPQQSDQSRLLSGPPFPWTCCLQRPPHLEGVLQIASSFLFPSLPKKKKKKGFKESLKVGTWE